MSNRFEEYPHAVIKKGPFYGKRGRYVKRKVTGGFNLAKNVLFEFEDGTIMEIHRSAIKSDPKGLIKPRSWWSENQMVTFILDRAKTKKGTSRKEILRLLRPHSVTEKKIHEAIMVAKEQGLCVVKVKRGSGTGDTQYTYKGNQQ